jgi:hypothetical protein
MNSKLPGTDLTGDDYEVLGRSYIPPTIAEAAHLRRVTDVEGRELLGINGRAGNYAGIAFPYYDPLTGNITCFRLRRDQPDLVQKQDRIVEQGKYLGAFGDHNHIYYPPFIPPLWLEDTTIPIIFVEGEKKTLCLGSIMWEQLQAGGKEKPLFLPVGLPGVWGWRGRVGKAVSPSGSSRDVHGVIPDLQSIRWTGRPVVIFFDSNVRTNPHVSQARNQLAGFLSAQGAKVRLADLPLEQNINGPDDAAAKHGPVYVLKIIDSARETDVEHLPQPLSSSEQEMLSAHPYSGFLRSYENFSRGCLAEVSREYHKLAGLILMGGILGPKLITDTGLRPNLAGIIVAFQGSGKSYPAVIARKLIDPIEKEEGIAYEKGLSQLRSELNETESSSDKRELQRELEELERKGRPTIIIATQASVEGLVEALATQSGGIADYDEFGGFLKECRRDHMRSARENLVKALDGRPILYRRTRGQSVDARNPCLSLWGTINVESLRISASGEDMFGGLFSRILFCAPDYDFAIPDPKPGDSHLGEELIGTLRKWRALESVQVRFAAGVAERATEYGYAIAPFSRGERVVVTEPEDEIASVGFVRYRTHALKVAILLAAGEIELRDNTVLAVGMFNLLQAIEIVDGFRQHVVRLLHYLERRDPLIADAEQLVGRIVKHPGRDRSQLQRQMHWDAKHFAQVIQEVERSGKVYYEDQPSTAGKTRRIYFPKSSANGAKR